MKSADMVVDCSPYSVVIVCRYCSWREIRDNRAAAWRAAAGHLRASHDYPVAADRALAAALTARKRHIRRMSGI